MEIDLEQVKVLLEMVSKTDIAELTIEMEEERITIKKSSGFNPGPGPAYAPMHHQGLPMPQAGPHAGDKPTQVFEAPQPVAGQSSEAKDGGIKQEDLIAVTAPMVGTFFRSPSPTAPKFVEVGDKIIVGQTVCIIEAMKLMNDLPSEVAGKVVKICAENGATVEYGQQLFLIDPKG